LPMYLKEPDERDPAIIELAKGIGGGVTPRCFAEMLRASAELLEYIETNPDFDPVHGDFQYANPVSEACAQEWVDQFTPGPATEYAVSNLTYERYTDDQLAALAPYEPDAAVILARRLDDDLASRAYYDL